MENENLKKFEIEFSSEFVIALLIMAIIGGCVAENKIKSDEKIEMRKIEIQLELNKGEIK